MYSLACNPYLNLHIYMPNINSYNKLKKRPIISWKLVPTSVKVKHIILPSYCKTVRSHPKAVSNMEVATKQEKVLTDVYNNKINAINCLIC